MCDNCVKANLIDNLASAQRLLDDIDALYGPLEDDVNLPDLSESQLKREQSPLISWRNGIN